MQTQLHFNLLTLPNNIIGNTNFITIPLKTFILQEVFNNSLIAKNHQVTYTIVIKWFIGKIVSNCKTITESF